MPLLLLVAETMNPVIVYSIFRHLGSFDKHDLCQCFTYIFHFVGIYPSRIEIRLESVLNKHP